MSGEAHPIRMWAWMLVMDLTKVLGAWRSDGWRWRLYLHACNRAGWCIEGLTDAELAAALHEVDDEW